MYLGLLATHVCVDILRKILAWHGGILCKTGASSGDVGAAGETLAEQDVKVCVPISRFSILPTSPAKSGGCPESIAFNQLWLPVKVEIGNAN